MKHLLSLFVLSLSSAGDGVAAFVVGPSPPRHFSYESSLSAVRQPRRNMKKRKGRERKSPSNRIDTTTADPTDEIELKPLIGYKRKEAGEDFWIDPSDFAKEKARQQAVMNRKSMEGEMSKEKLRSEVVAPYKQNWIGVISVAIIILTAIVQNFPEALDSPSTIRFPDLDAGDPIPMQTTLKRAVIETTTLQ